LELAEPFPGISQAPLSPLGAENQAVSEQRVLFGAIREERDQEALFVSL